MEALVSFFESSGYRFYGGIISILMGVYIGAFPLKSLLTAIQMRKWKSVNGLITKSEVGQITDEEDEILFFFDFEYEYHLSSKKFTATGRFLEPELKKIMGW